MPTHMTDDILLFTLNMHDATTEIKSFGGRVTQQFTDNMINHGYTNSVFVAVLPDISVVGKLKNSRPQPYDPLDNVSKLVVAAWNSFQSKLPAEKDTASPAKGLSWSAAGLQPPLKLGWDGEREREITLGSTGVATSLYLIGSVAIGVIIVSGSYAPLAFSDDDKIKVLAETMQGLKFLVHAEPLANISFVYNIHSVMVTALPDESCNDFNSCEEIWRDPALNELGYPAGMQGCREFAAGLKNINDTNWSFLAFFTKYRLYHWAYAGSVRLCMEYFNNWRQDNINIYAVIAHEVCHIFGAADEYANEVGQCSCDKSGYLKIPNKNCVKCGDHVPCLMDEGTLRLCPWSRLQLGWSSKFFDPLLFKQISPVCDKSDNLFVWAVDVDNKVYLRYRDNGEWTGWEAGWFNAPALQNIAPLWDDTDNIHVFGVGEDNIIYLNKRIHGKWSGWLSPWSAGPRLQRIDTFKDGDNNLYVFGIGTDNTVFLYKHEGDSWSSWQANWHNAPKMKSVSGISDRNNNVYIFGIGTDNTVYFIKHEGDSWSRWQQNWYNASKMKSILPVIDPLSDTVYVFGVGMDNRMYVIHGSRDQWSDWIINWEGMSWMQHFGAATDSLGVLNVWGIAPDGTSFLNYLYKGKWVGWHEKWGRPADFLTPNLYFLTPVFDRNDNPHVWGLGINNNAMGNNNVEYFNWRDKDIWSGWQYQWGM